MDERPNIMPTGRPDPGKPWAIAVFVVFVLTGAIFLTSVATGVVWWPMSTFASRVTPYLIFAGNVASAAMYLTHCRQIWHLPLHLRAMGMIGGLVPILLLLSCVFGVLSLVCSLP